MSCANCGKERPAAFFHICGGRLCHECYPLLRIDYHDYLKGRDHVRHGELCYKCRMAIWALPEKSFASLVRKKRMSDQKK